MLATYGRSIWSGSAIKGFDVLAGFICYILTCLRCLWARAELQDSQLRGPSFQMGNFQFLPGSKKLLIVHSATSCFKLLQAAAANGAAPMAGVGDGWGGVGGGGGGAVGGWGATTRPAAAADGWGPAERRVDPSTHGGPGWTAPMTAPMTAIRLTPAAAAAAVGADDDMVVAVCHGCIQRGASRAEFVAELGRLIDAADADRLAALLYDGPQQQEPPRATAAAGPPRAEHSWPRRGRSRGPPPWARRAGVRRPVHELKRALLLAGVETSGMLERAELEGALDAASTSAASQELIALAGWLMPTPVEQQARAGLIARAGAVVAAVLPGAAVVPYGSEAIGLAAFNSDIDLMVDWGLSGGRTSGGSSWALERLGDGFRAAGWAVQVEVRTHARVPIVNLTDR